MEMESLDWFGHLPWTEHEFTRRVEWRFLAWNIVAIVLLLCCCRVVVVLCVVVVVMVVVRTDDLTRVFVNTRQ